MSAGRRNKGRRVQGLGPAPGSKADRWRRSPEFRAIANRALADFNAQRWRLKRCGAKTKGSGQPCRQPALENGRCRLHGGLTPKGDAWHKIRMPKRGEVGGLKKFDRKIDAQIKAQAERKRRRAAMTPEERERHDAWQASHLPGKASDRAHRRQQLATKRLFESILSPARAAMAEEEDVFS